MSCQTGMQAKVDQAPVFSKMGKKGKWSSNQVMGKSKIIRPNKRKKVKYL